jgi:hypothetical protein
MTHGIAADRLPSAAFAEGTEPPVKDGAGPAQGERRGRTPVEEDGRARESQKKKESVWESVPTFFRMKKCYNSQTKTPN